VAQKFHFAILRIEVTRASRGLSAIAQLPVRQVALKLGTHYPCSRAVFTGRTVNMGVQKAKWCPCSRAVNTAHEHGPWTRVVCTEFNSNKHIVRSTNILVNLSVWQNTCT